MPKTTIAYERLAFNPRSRDRWAVNQTCWIEGVFDVNQRDCTSIPGTRLPMGSQWTYILHF